MIGLLNYVAEVYGKPASVKTLDAIASEHIGRDLPSVSAPPSIVNGSRP